MIYTISSSARRTLISKNISKTEVNVFLPFSVPTTLPPWLFSQQGKPEITLDWGEEGIGGHNCMAAADSVVVLLELDV